MIEDGIVPELLLGRKYGHRLHFWDMKTRTHTQTVDLGDEHQMALELRPAHDPTKKYGFVGVVVSVEDLSASIWLWHEEDGHWAATKVISIPAEPAPAEQLPPLLQGFGAVPPLVTDIGLSVDDRLLYVSCWGTGELKQFDVTDPFHPVETGSVRIGGIVGRVPHPARPDQRLVLLPLSTLTGNGGLPAAPVHDLVERAPVRPLDRRQRPVGGIAERDHVREELPVREAQ